MLQCSQNNYIVLPHCIIMPIIMLTGTFNSYYINDDCWSELSCWDFKIEKTLLRPKMVGLAIRLWLQQTSEEGLCNTNTQFTLKLGKEVANPAPLYKQNRTISLLILWLLHHESLRALSDAVTDSGSVEHDGSLFLPLTLPVVRVFWRIFSAFRTSWGSKTI